MSEQILMKRLMALDFMAIDLALFLDTHPADKKAIETYNAVVEEGKKVRCEYEKEYGPISPASGAPDGCWRWIEEPWPWEAKANFCFSSDE